MLNLVNEYTDTKNVKHTVQHTTLPENDNYNRERIIEELMFALTNKYKITAPN